MNVLKNIEKDLNANIVALEIPVGEADTFTGVIDLLDIDLENLPPFHPNSSGVVGRGI